MNPCEPTSLRAAWLRAKLMALSHALEVTPERPNPLFTTVCAKMFTQDQSRSGNAECVVTHDGTGILALAPAHRKVLRLYLLTAEIILDADISVRGYRLPIGVIRARIRKGREDDHRVTISRGKSCTTPATHVR